MKTDSGGNVIWHREYNKNQHNDLFYSVLATDDGGFLLSGQAMNLENSSQDAWLLKVDLVGCPYLNCLVGIEENEEKTVLVNVWPNPVAEQLNIEWQKSEMATIQLYDLSGRIILTQAGGYQQMEQLDVSLMPNGLYILHLKQGNSHISMRISIQH